MTPIREFDRRSARVKAMRLDNAQELYAAHEWLRAHGVAAYPGELDSVLVIHRAQGEPEVARLGQWLAHDPGSNTFAVYDHGDEPGQFGREHDETVGVQ